MLVARNPEPGWMHFPIKPDLVAVDIEAGSSNFPLSETGDSINLLNLAALSFINGNDVVGTVYVNSFPGLTPTSSIEASILQPAAGDNLTITGGIDVSEGILNVYMTSGTTLTLDGNSLITAANTDAGSTATNWLNIVTNGSPDPLGTTLKLNGTITLGAIGHNILSLEDVNTVGGTVIEDGEESVIHLGANFAGDPDEGIGTTTGTDFQINSGLVTMTGLDGFGGTFGPVGSNASSAPSLGFLAEIDVYNAMTAARATFDTSTGMLSIFDGNGKDLGNLHFAGNASGLFLDMQGGVLSIHDTGANPYQGNVPITFHS